jgi:hypothetical protein
MIEDKEFNTNDTGHGHIKGSRGSGYGNGFGHGKGHGYGSGHGSSYGSGHCSGIGHNNR